MLEIRFKHFAPTSSSRVSLSNFDCAALVFLPLPFWEQLQNAMPILKLFKKNDGSVVPGIDFLVYSYLSCTCRTYCKMDFM